MVLPPVGPASGVGQRLGAFGVDSAKLWPPHAHRHEHSCFCGGSGGKPIVGASWQITPFDANPSPEVGGGSGLFAEHRPVARLKKMRLAQGYFVAGHDGPDQASGLAGGHGRAES